jgi:Lrp/AsnC family leucine-responsive transcriptional regulator
MAGRRRSSCTTVDPKLLDPTNLRLLGELQQDARLSLAELGRRVGLSPPAVAERVARLEEEGVIRGYRVELDPRALGLALSVVLRIRPAPRQIPAVAELAQRTPEVVECVRVTGEDCYVMRLHVRDVEHLEEVIDRFTPYGTTTTALCQSAPVPGRGLDLETLSGDPGPGRAARGAPRAAGRARPARSRSG